ncbi:MAG: carotenoid oxygenase family protein [Deltaproteobacteria bacterium]|jgi:all-trans-8'-apo-beta-carotenal 15,15'-oxygenase|nr:carotenoid oxygenase family protein [Deltaproteobacteria bacterium]
MEFTRRDFFKIAAASIGTAAVSGCSSHHPPLKTTDFENQDYKHFPALGLVTSVREEYKYEARVEGAIPQELRGTLYRNGPGLFERAGLRKRCMLDGDGMIQAFRFGHGRVQYQNKFVQTEKYVKESQTGKFIYATWSTQAPGGVLPNFLSKAKSQAGVTAIVRDNRLYAFDDFNYPYQLDPNTLDTLGIADFGLPGQPVRFFAHTKMDPRTGEWFLFGIEYGPRVDLHMTVFNNSDKPIKHQAYRLPRNTYVHDFFVTEKHIIFILPAIDINFFEVLTGQKSFLGAISWKPEIGNIVCVFDRHGDRPPIQLETEACWSWHTINAYEADDEIIADFIGYQNPDHIIGDDPALFAIMSGRKGQYSYPGEIRRYVINTARKTIHFEILDDGNYEFPAINLDHQCQRYRFGYFAKKQDRELFFTGITRVDMKTLRSESFDFGQATYCSEPVFVPKPGFKYSADTKAESGWLLTEVYDGGKHKTLLAIFEAERIADGPVAQAYLDDALPLGFHGYWHSQP